jgi:hypothetical protein
VKQSLSSAYHPQTDGQTERANRVIEDMLKHYVSKSQTDWYLYLPYVEFAINNSKHEGTQRSPFYLTKGQHPVTPGMNGLTYPSTFRPAPRSFCVAWQEAMARARRCLQAANDRMSTRYKKKHKHPSYTPKQLVLLSTQNMTLALPGIKKVTSKILRPVSNS